MERSTAYHIVKIFETLSFFPNKNLNDPIITSENHILTFCDKITFSFFAVHNKILNL